MIITRTNFDTKGKARGFQIRSEDKTVHVVPDTSQGAELSRTRVETSPSRETLDSSTLDQLSVKTYPASKWPSVILACWKSQSAVLLIAH
jgi:hypothetical protein